MFCRIAQPRVAGWSTRVYRRAILQAGSVDAKRQLHLDYKRDVMDDSLGEFRSKRIDCTLAKTVDGQVQLTASYESLSTGFGAFFGP